MNNPKHSYTEIDYRAVGERIKLIRGAKSQDNFAKEFELGQVDISRIERGEIRPTAELLYNLCIIYRKDLAWLLTGEGESEDRREAPRIAGEAALPYGDFEFVPVVSGKLSAGKGVIPDERIEMKVAFRNDWIRRKGDPGKMSLIRVDGDSMEPTLMDGDLVLVDRGRNFVDPAGGIYAITIDDESAVKRLQPIFPSSRMRIISDNPVYPPIEADPDQIRISGKVIWFGRELER